MTDGSVMMTYNEYLENILKPDKQTKKAAKARFTLAGEVSSYR